MNEITGVKSLAEPTGRDSIAFSPTVPGGKIQLMAGSPGKSQNGIQFLLNPQSVRGAVDTCWTVSAWTCSESVFEHLHQLSH